ncbi:MAG: nucleoside triphosphate pyrophosphohydrolase [Desulfotomaculales bacterium]
MGPIILAGLGPGDRRAVPVGVLEALKRGPQVILRTSVHPVVPWLKQQGIKFSACDRFYEEAATFEEVYRRVARTVVAAVRRGPVVYAVPGHPLVAETPSRYILEEARQKDIEVEILPAPSFVDAVFAALRLDPIAGVQLIDGLNIAAQQPATRAGNIVMQVHDRLTAAAVKIRLMEFFPDEHPVTVIRAAGVPGEERIERVRLFEVDRLPWIDHLTSFYVPPATGEPKEYPLGSLAAVMAALRGEGGCPWDRQQTHDTLKRYLLEETYEVLEAIESGNMHSLCEELGDLLLQIVFHARIAEEKGYFDLADVVRGITAKMLRRHPHVFGPERADSAADVLRRWEEIKEDEKGGEGGLLDGIPRTLPALVRAERVQERAAQVGFDWPDYRGALAKLEEELAEVRTALEAGDRERVARELGDLLFATVNVARLVNVEAEGALRQAITKFVRRFTFIEDELKARGKRPGEVSLEEMDAFWEEEKMREKAWKVSAMKQEK